MKKHPLFRILDANFNRSREGLRVCEEVMRFIVEDEALTKNLKRARHSVTDCLKKMPFRWADLVACRDVAEDFGKKPSALEKPRTDAASLFLANIERVKESLRVLEESFKLLDVATAMRFKKIRFEVYAIEKKSMPKLETLCDNGPFTLPGVNTAANRKKSDSRRRVRRSAAR